MFYDDMDQWIKEYHCDNLISKQHTNLTSMNIIAKGYDMQETTNYNGNFGKCSFLFEKILVFVEN